MSLKAVFFDLDGTLIDSKRDIVETVNQLRNELDLETLSQEKIISLVGRGTKALLKDILNDSIPVDSVYDKFINYYKQNTQKYSTIYDGVYELLDSIKPLKKVLITNKSFEVTKTVLGKFNFTDTFDIVYGGDTFLERKPSPYPLIQAMKELNLNSNEVIYFGDSFPDYKASIDAGVKCFLATYGYGANLEVCNKATFINSPLELLKYI